MDLAVAMALASSLLDKALPEKAVFVGELGLGGEIRSVTDAEMRLKEAAAIGMTEVYMPNSNARKIKNSGSVKIHSCKTIGDLLAELFRM